MKMIGNGNNRAVMLSVVAAVYVVLDGSVTVPV
jgi:hypothetical protein